MAGFAQVKKPAAVAYHAIFIELAAELGSP